MYCMLLCPKAVSDYVFQYICECYAHTCEWLNIFECICMVLLVSVCVCLCVCVCVFVWVGWMGRGNLLQWCWFGWEALKEVCVCVGVSVFVCLWYGCVYQ